GAAAVADVPPARWGQLPSPSAVIRVSFWLSSLGAVLEALAAAAADAGVRPAVSGPAGAGALYACLDPATSHDAVARFVAGLRERIGRALGARGSRVGVVVLAAPPPVLEAVSAASTIPVTGCSPAVSWEATDAGREHAARGGEGLRALRVLPAGLPDLPAVGRGDGLAAGPDPPGEPDPRRRPAVRLRRRALRPLPGLHGLHDRLPVGRAVRPAHRGGPGMDRRGAILGARRRSRRAGADGAGPGGAGGHLLPVPVPQAAAGADRAAAGGAADGARPPAGPVQPAGTGLPRARGGAAAGPAGRFGGVGAAAARAGARARHPAGRGRHAHRVRAVGVLPAGERRGRPGARGRGLRRNHPARARLLRRAVTALR